MSEAVFEISQRESNLRYLVRLKDSQGNELLTSQYREQKPMAKNEIAWIRGVGAKDNCFERVSNGDQWWFVLHATDAHILGTSSRYASEEDRERAIVQVKNVASRAEVIDLTPEIDLETRIHDVLQAHAREVEACCASGV